jgi:hypothetical protein
MEQNKLVGLNPVFICFDLLQGEIIRSVWKSGNLEIKQKGVDDPFTKADVDGQRRIMGLLRKQWSDIKIIGN